ncbi:MAG: hypothetical protein ACI81R_002331 [Bradymonadia bacterium]|jgi:hypothetical protein
MNFRITSRRTGNGGDAVALTFGDMPSVAYVALVSPGAQVGAGLAERIREEGLVVAATDADTSTFDLIETLTEPEGGMAGKRRRRRAKRVKRRVRRTKRKLRRTRKRQARAKKRGWRPGKLIGRARRAQRVARLKGRAGRLKARSNRLTTLTTRARPTSRPISLPKVPSTGTLRVTAPAAGLVIVNGSPAGRILANGSSASTLGPGRYDVRIQFDDGTLSATKTALVRVGSDTAISVEVAEPQTIVAGPLQSPSALTADLPAQALLDDAFDDDGAEFEDLDVLDDESSSSGNAAKYGAAALAGVALLVAMS